MRFVKGLALVVGSLLLIPVSVLLIGVLFQSLLGAAVFIILPCVGLGYDRYAARETDRAMLTFWQHTASPDQATSPAFSRTRMAAVTAWRGPDDELRETPRYSDHIRTGGPGIASPTPAGAPRPPLSVDGAPRAGVQVQRMKHRVSPGDWQEARRAMRFHQMPPEQGVGARPWWHLSSHWG